MVEQQIEWQRMIDTALTLPGAMGRTYCRFYNYSFGNQILLAMQGVAEPVATYKRWLEMGRQVRKGSKARSILRPLMAKRTAKDESGEETEKFFVRGFKLVRCLFPVSDTDGDDLPEVEFPEWSLDKALSALRIERVPYQIADGNTQGYSTGRTFAINPVAVYPFKTTMHELAHIVLGHTTEDGHVQHRGVQEFQAEASALLVMKELEATDRMDEEESRAYVQGWLKGDRPEDKEVKAVFDAVNKILKAGRGEEVRV